MAQHWQEIVPIDRYIVSASGLLHEYDRKVLTFLYQPLIGPICFSLYMTLWTEIEESRLSSKSSTHHFLMNLMEINMQKIYEARLKLEGIGLLKTFVKKEDDNRSFIYELLPPLSPEQFFQDGMLNIYLYQKIGKNHYTRLKRFFSDQKIQKENEFMDVTRAFHDVFHSANPDSLQYLQDVEDLEVDEGKQYIGRKEQKPIVIDINSFDFDLLLAGLNESLVPKKALTKKVKEAISNLAFLYNINPIDMKGFILGAINEKNEIDIEDLRKGARDWYQFINYDQLPSLINRTQPSAHKNQLTEPKTPEEKLIHYYENTSPAMVFQQISGGVVPTDFELKILEEVMLKQKLLPGVVNVLIDLVMKKTDMKFTKGYVESIASHWARKQIKTVKDAIEYARQDERNRNMEKNNKASKTGPYKKPTRTEFLPDWFKEDRLVQPAPQPIEKDEDLEAKKKEIEEKLKALRQ